MSEVEERNISIHKINIDDETYQVCYNPSIALFIGDIDACLDCYNKWNKGESIKGTDIADRGNFFEFIEFGVPISMNGKNKRPKL